MPLRFNIKVNEDSSCRLTFQLQDFDGNAIASTAINTATMTITDKLTEATINSREDVDVSGDFDESGNFSRILTASDNAMVGSNSEEVHVVTFSINATVSGSTVDLVENCLVTVINLDFV